VAEGSAWKNGFFLHKYVKIMQCYSGRLWHCRHPEQGVPVQCLCWSRFSAERAALLILTLNQHFPGTGHQARGALLSKAEGKPIALQHESAGRASPVVHCRCQPSEPPARDQFPDGSGGGLRRGFRLSSGLSEGGGAEVSGGGGRPGRKPAGGAESFGALSRSAAVM
jgi:hypothetical protein